MEPTTSAAAASSSSRTDAVERKLKYKKLIEKGAKIGESIANQNVIDSLTGLMDIITNCENISTGFAREAKVENTSDYLLDAQIIKMSHDLVGSMTEKISQNDFREDEFIASLVNCMTADPNKILNTAISCCRNAKFQLSLLGTFEFDDIDKTLNKTKRVVQRKRKTLEPKAAPENVKSEAVKSGDQGAAKVNQVLAEMSRVFKERRVEHVPYFEIVTNPNSFMNTVDIAFQVAFLVRDGLVGVKLVKNEPHVFLKLHESSQSQAHGTDSADAGQAIMTLNPAKWKEEIIKYKLREPILKLGSSQIVVEEESSSDSD